MTEVIKGAAVGAVTGAIDTGAKIAGISDEVISADSTEKKKTSISNKKKKTGK